VGVETVNGNHNFGLHLMKEISVEYVELVAGVIAENLCG